MSDNPNILIIWGDDIGMSNLSCYSDGVMGYRTRNIDRIAEEGVRFTDHYGEQSCTAGRAAFITGQNPYRTGLTKVGLPGATLGLQPQDPTIATALKAQGYATGQFGKNHLGDRDEHLPTMHGFDEFFGNLYHLNAEEEPELPDYPKDPAFREKFGPRGVLHTWANPEGTQRIEDTGPLTKKRMETCDEEFRDAAADFIRRTSGGPPESGTGPRRFARDRMQEPKSPITQRLIDCIESLLGPQSRHRRVPPPDPFSCNAVKWCVLLRLHQMIGHGLKGRDRRRVREVVGPDGGGREADDDHLRRRIHIDRLAHNAPGHEHAVRVAADPPHVAIAVALRQDVAGADEVFGLAALADIGDLSVNAAVARDGRQDGDAVECATPQHRCHGMPRFMARRQVSLSAVDCIHDRMIGAV